MALSLVSEPVKTINFIVSNVNASRAQMPYEFFEDDLVGKENYKVNIRVLDENDVDLIDLTFKYSPKPDGALFVDIGLIISEIHEEEIVVSRQFRLQYFESYTGFTGVPVLSSIILSVYAEKQIQSKGGSNLWDYLLNGPKSKILTKFKNPLVWKGWKRTISWLIDDGLATRTGSANSALKETALNINKVPSLAPITSADFSTIGIGEAVLSDNYLLDNFNRCEILSGGVLSEAIDYEVREDCSNPIMVEWLNSIGGFEQHLFNISHEAQVKSFRGVEGEQAIVEDIETVRRTKFRLPSIWVQQMILRAERLTIGQLRALREIKSSAGVRVFLNNSGSKWVGVVVSNNFDTIFNDENTLFDFQVQIAFPDNFDYYDGTEVVNQPDTPPFQPESLIDSDNDILIDSDLNTLIG